MKEEANRWLRKALENLQAIHILQERDDVEFLTSSIGFHCQQAIEKSFLVFHKLEFKKTHDLNQLRDKCSEIDKEFSILEFDNLIDFAVDYHYPDETYIPDIEEITKYSKLALKIKNLVENKISEYED